MQLTRAAAARCGEQGRFRNPNQEVTWHGPRTGQALAALRQSAQGDASSSSAAQQQQQQQLSPGAQAGKGGAGAYMGAALGARDAANATAREVWVKQNVAMGQPEQVRRCRLAFSSLPPLPPSSLRSVA